MNQNYKNSSSYQERKDPLRAEIERNIGKINLNNSTELLLYLVSNSTCTKILHSGCGRLLELQY
jgi:hypothetical protein